jgi:predicted transposase/invertase (TIGR01784 family)
MLGAVNKGEVNSELYHKLLDFSGGDPIMKDAIVQWSKVSQDEQEWAEYQSIQKSILDETANLRAAEEEARLAEKIEIAVELLKLGVPDEAILQATKLSEKSLDQIKESIEK